MPIVLKSGSLNLLEPPGPLQACNGTALTFYLLPSFTMNYSVTNKKVSHFCSDTNLSSCTEVSFLLTAANEQWQLVSCAVSDKCPTSCIFCICYPANTNAVILLQSVSCCGKYSCPVLNCLSLSVGEAISFLMAFN